MRPRVLPALSRWAHAWLASRLGSSVSLVALMAVAALVYTRPLWEPIDNWGIQDWDISFFGQGAARRTILEYHQVPLWNPWISGGVPSLTALGSRVLAPTFLSTLWLGEVRSIKVEVVLFYVVGLCGAYLFARSHQLSRQASFVAAVFYMFSGMATLSIASGMVAFASCAFVPWTFWAFEEGIKAPVFGLVCGLFMVLMFFTQGTVLVVLTGLALAVYAALLVVSGRARWRRSVAVLALAATVALGVSALRWLPVAANTSFLAARAGCLADVKSGFSVASFARGLVSRDQTVARLPEPDREMRFWSGQSWGDDENGMYVGWLGVSLFLVGLALGRKAVLPLAVFWLVWVWIAFGDRPYLSPWGLFRGLPLFDNMRVAERSKFVFMMPMGIIAGVAVDRLTALVKRRTFATRAFGVVAAVGLFVDLVCVNSPQLGYGSIVPPLPVQPGREFVTASRLPLYGPDGEISQPEQRTGLMSYDALYPAFLSNWGTVETSMQTCPDQRSSVITNEDPAYAGEVFLAEGAGVAQLTHWSPNRLSIATTTREGGVVVVNQNYHIGWRSDGQPPFPRGGRVAVRVGPGQQEVHLHFEPPLLRTGTGVSLASLITAISAICVVRRRWRPKANRSAERAA